MRKFAIALLAVAAASTAAVGDANAQNRRWCSQGHIGSGFPYCGFDTLQQCRAYVRGLGRSCTENPQYVAPGRKKTRQY